MAATKVQYPVWLRLHLHRLASFEVREPIIRLVASIDELLLERSLPRWPTRQEDMAWAPAGVRRLRDAQSSKRGVSSLTTSDAYRSERAAVEPTLLSTNRYCQHFSPETLPDFLKGEDESGLKRRLKCWSAWGGSSGDSANEKGGDVQ